MRVLGVDPGLRVTGYACVEGDWLRPTIVEAGVFRLEKAGRGLEGAASIAARLVELERDLAGVVERTRPELAAVEDYYVHPGRAKSSMVQGHARGVVLVTLARAGVGLVELRPAEAKKAATGNGQASKAQVQAAVQQMYGLSELPTPADLADALAIAAAGLARHG